jgi:hypothetical protein
MPLLRAYRSSNWTSRRNSIILSRTLRTVRITKDPHYLARADAVICSLCQAPRQRAVGAPTRNHHLGISSRLTALAFITSPNTSLSDKTFHTVLIVRNYIIDELERAATIFRELFSIESRSERFSD